MITENNAQQIVDNGEAANAIFYESHGRYQQSTPVTRPELRALRICSWKH